MSDLDHFNGMLAGMDWGDPEGLDCRDKDDAPAPITCRECDKDLSEEHYSVGRELTWQARFGHFGHFHRIHRCIYCRECQEQDDYDFRDSTAVFSAETADITAMSARGEA